MRASRLLILAFVSIVETTADYPAIGEIELGSSSLRYPANPAAMLDDENPRDRRSRDSPDELQERMTASRRYRHKKMHRWSDPVRYKKPARPGGPKRRRRPKKMRSSDNRPIRVRSRNPKFPHRPSMYLEPPETLKSEYDLYSPREIPLADEPFSSEPAPATDSNVENHRLHAEDEEESEDIDRPTYIRDHAPEQQAGATGDIETNDDAETSREKSGPLPDSPKDRIEFHIQGHEGPETYIFGYDTGLGNNRQYRLEERHEDGSVTGHYGYVDARGKLRKVRYKASPTQGYVEKLDHANEQEA